MQQGYTQLLASKGLRWEVALQALQTAISTLANFHQALASMPGAGPLQRGSAWFDDLLDEVGQVLGRVSGHQGVLLHQAWQACMPMLLQQIVEIRSAATRMLALWAGALQTGASPALGGLRASSPTPHHPAGWQPGLAGRGGRGQARTGAVHRAGQPGALSPARGGAPDATVHWCHTQCVLHVQPTCVCGAAGLMRALGVQRLCRACT